MGVLGFGPGMFSVEDMKDPLHMEKNLMKMDPVSLRAVIRQAAHWIDNGIQRYHQHSELPKAMLDSASIVLKLALKVWEKRGYESDKGDIKYSFDALRKSDAFEKTLIYQPSPPCAPFSENDLKTLERTIVERRSIRRFSPRDVSDSLIEKIIEAGIWAPSACSLQGFRFFVIKDAEKKKLIRQPWIVPVIIIAGLDERPYEFIRMNQLSYNCYLELGAAIQNMLLMAYALGLGTSLGTFVGELDLIRRALKVPDYIKIITYFALGWPEDQPTTVPRMELKEFVTREEWTGD